MADDRVLEAQKWVNATYAGVAGYSPCPETGNTGWSTMYALTNALQHELGISPLSSSFGPTTMSKVDARGGVGPGETNKNLVKIVQAACFCKGYNPGAIDGNWYLPGPGTYYSVHTAIQQMTSDMGIGAQGRLNAKTFKALLTMDAYVLVSGGNTEVRDIQRWLNGRYWQRSFATIIPTEGHYSRDVQTMLMKALQSEFGIADSSVTGNFGPATQTGLRNNQLAEGATGIFVQLLSAACVFNGPVPNSGGSTTSTVFKSTFDSALGTYLSDFQWFSLLTQNRRADYPTWCQLLVSMGDPDRPAGACDTRFTINQPLATSLVSNGYKVVGRYLDETATSTLNKEIQPGELSAIFAGGMKVFPIWQYNARLLGDFTWSEGYSHAQKAHDRMVHYGFNRGAIIYFAVDYDATDPEITSNIVPYFRGVQAGLANRGHRYRAGVYGSRNVCTRVSNETLVVSSFVSGMSWGFSGNLGFPLPYNWAFNQIKEFRYTGGGQTIDLDRVVHRTSVDPGIGASGVGGGNSSTAAAMLAHIDEVHEHARLHDGTTSTATINIRVLQFLRSPKYTKDYGGWDILLGPWDQNWIDSAAARFPNRPFTFEDPVYGESISIDHLAATANAVLLKGWGSGATANRGDFGGWGGDLATFYADWMNNESSYASGYAFCMDRMAKRGVTSSFGFSDMVEDADGFLMGRACRNGSAFKTAFRSHLTGTGASTRFKDLYSLRFGSSVTTAEGAARHMLLDTSDDGLSTVRAGIYAGILKDLNATPPTLPAYKLDPFLKGFADTIKNQAANG
ncbi:MULTISPECIES: glycoside hydrolase domain-containing protein [unclassified Knoellia]|uniref:glycoside hydrolase domain-containing protein n=1 Tax=Knoellia altitudinis TaxID=3404795 RepID=UPI00361253AC